MSTLDAQSTTCMGCLINPHWNWQLPYLMPPSPLHYTPIQQSNDVSLTNEEKEVLCFLKELWNKFVALDKSTSDNLDEFRDAIHRCQQIIGLRVARRADPDVWRQPE